MRNELPNPNTIQKALHGALRAWRSTPLREQPLFERLLFFRAGRGQRTQPGITLLRRQYEQLQAAIAEFSFEPRHAEVLMRRFWREHSSQQIALDWHCSADHVNRVQREAILGLAGWLLSQEAALRRTEYSRLLTKLPASSYSQLVGRETQIEHIRSALRQPSGSGVVAITGLGGLGKTAIADAAVRGLLGEWIFEDVVWLRLQGEEASSWQAVKERLAQHTLPNCLPGSEADAELLQHLKLCPTLVVLDNLETEAAEDWLERLYTLCHPSKFLLTHRQLPAVLHTVHTVRLKELDRAAAEDFLRQQVEQLGQRHSKPLSADQLETIFEHTGGNPLALKLVAGLLHSLSLSSVLRALRSGSSGNTEALYTKIYQAAWETLAAEARKLLSVFLLVGGEGASLAQLQAIDGLTERQRHDALQQLAGRSLLELRQSTGDPRYGVHRLTQTFLESVLAAAGRDSPLDKAVEANLRYWQTSLTRQELPEEGNLARALQHGLAKPDHWPASVALLGSLFARVRSKAGAQRWLPFYQRAAELAPNPQAVPASLYNQLGALAWLAEEQAAARSWFEAAQQRAAHPQQAQTALVGLCLSHWSEAEHELAASHAKQALALAPSEPRLLALQGLVSYSRGHFQTAEKHFRQALRRLGPAHSPALHTQLRVQRGLCQQMAGRPKEALRHYASARQALREQPAEAPREQAHLELLRSSAFFQMDDEENGNASLRKAVRYTPLLRERQQAYFASNLGQLTWPGETRSSPPEMVLNPLHLLRSEDFE